MLRRAAHLDPADVWLATTDADTLVPPCWLREQARYANRGWDAVAGTIRIADWSGHQPGTRSLFRKRYGRGAGPHSHVHGANLGFGAAAYQRAGGFPDVPTGEDHALVAALTAAGGRVLRTPVRSPWSPRPDAMPVPRRASATTSRDWTPRRTRPPPEGTAAARDVCRLASG